MDDCFKSFKKLVEKQYSRAIKSVQTDNAKEFLKLTTNLRDEGIVHRLSCPHTHPQMGKVVRRHRHIVDIGLALMKHAGLEEQFWDYGFMTAVYLYNRNPTKVLCDISPYEALHQRSPKYRKLRVFGSKCYLNLRPYRDNKLADKSAPFTFMGYPMNSEGYICMDMKDGRIVISRDVRFIENQFVAKPQSVIRTGEKSDSKSYDDQSHPQSDSDEDEVVQPVNGQSQNLIETRPETGLESNQEIEEIQNMEHEGEESEVEDSESGSISSGEEYRPEDISDEGDTNHIPVTRGARGIVKKNPRFALSISPTQ